MSAGKKALGIAASIFGAGIGAFVIKPFGASLLWPVALIGIAWFILAKCKIEAPAIPMVAVLLGHTGWMVVGQARLRGRFVAGAFASVGWFMLAFRGMSLDWAEPFKLKLA